MDNDRLRLAKEALESGSYDKETIEHLFPELKESEDERARKEITNLVMQPTWKTESEFHRRKELVAWLENQDEQNPYGQRQECIDCQFNYAGECKGSCAMKRGKQKPVVIPKFKVGDKIQYSKGCGTIMTIEKIENGEYIFANNMGHTTIESGNEWHLVEQKPADKIEPKFRIGDSIEPIDSCLGSPRIIYKMYDGWYETTLNFESENNWRPIEQKPVEWSEEDSNIWNRTLLYLENMKDSCSIDCVPYINKCIIWVKSLKERYAWKPSDEQMNALDSALRYSQVSHNSFKPLNSLFNDLKKLRENKV